MNGRTVHSASTVVLSLLMLIIGVALLAQALAGDGSILSGRAVLAFCSSPRGRAGCTWRLAAAGTSSR